MVSSSDKSQSASSGSSVLWTALGMCGLCVLVACGPTAEADAPRRDPGGAVQDVQLVADWIDAAHPRPYRYQSSTEFRERTDELSESLRRGGEVTDLEVAAAVRRLLAPLRDGHMAVGVPRFQPGSDVGLLPVPVRVIDGSIYVDGEHERLAHGSRVTAIDGREAKTILEELTPLLLADGSGEAPRRALLDRDFLQLYHLRFGVRETHSFRVDQASDAEVPNDPIPVDGDDSQEELPEQGTVEVELPSVPFSQRAELAASRRTEPRWVALLAEEDRAPQLAFPEAGIAHLALPTFAVADDRNYATQLELAFERVTFEARALIIDLRGNEGGYRTRGAELLGHLLSEGFVQWKGYGVRIRAVPDEFEPFVQGLFPGVQEALRSFPEETDSRGLHYRASDPLADRFRPRAPQYAGPVVVLVDGLTASAASETLAGLLAQRPGVQVVGQETLGPCDEHVGELPMVLTTPNFGVAVLSSLALIDQIDTADCQPGRGTVPDIVIRPTALDVLTGHDVVLERGIQVAQQLADSPAASDEAPP